MSWWRQDWLEWALLKSRETCFANQEEELCELLEDWPFSNLGLDAKFGFLTSSGCDSSVGR